MSQFQIILILYLCFLICGAYYGWKSGSKISLTMGLLSSLLVLGGIFLIDINFLYGYSLIAIVSGLLSIVFLIRLIKTGKFIPAGMLLGVSVPILLLSLCRLLGA